MARLILTSIGLETDVLPFIGLGGHLVRSGHDVVLITHGLYADRCSEAGVPMVALDTPGDYAAMARDWAAQGHPLSLPALFRRHFLPRAQVECDLIRGRIVPKQTVLVASEFPGFAARIMAQTQRVPLISIFTRRAQIGFGRLYPELFQFMLAEDVNLLLNREGWIGRADLASWWNMPRDGIAFWDGSDRVADAWPCRLTPVGAADGDSMDAVAATAAVVERVVAGLSRRT